MRVEHDGRYLVVASKGGHPDAAGVVLERPQATRTSNCRTAPSSATTSPASSPGDERAEWWARALEVWPDYDSYQTKTDRLIAVFLLEPIEE